MDYAPKQMGLITSYYGIMRDLSIKWLQSPPPAASSGTIMSSLAVGETVILMTPPEYHY